MFLLEEWMRKCLFLHYVAVNRLSYTSSPWRVGVFVTRICEWVVLFPAFVFVLFIAWAAKPLAPTAGRMREVIAFSCAGEPPFCNQGISHEWATTEHTSISQQPELPSLGICGDACTALAGQMVTVWAERDRERERVRAKGKERGRKKNTKRREKRVRQMSLGLCSGNCSLLSKH